MSQRKSPRPQPGTRDESRYTNILLEGLRSEFHVFGETLQDVKKDTADLKIRVTRLEEDMSFIKPAVLNLGKDMVEVKVDIRGLKEDVRVLKDDVRVLKDDVRVLNVDMKAVKADVKELKGDVGTLKTEVKAIHTDMTGFDQRLHTIEARGA